MILLSRKCLAEDAHRQTASNWMHFLHAISMRGLFMSGPRNENASFKLFDSLDYYLQSGLTPGYLLDGWMIGGLSG